jgi:hypothetical protein
MSPAWATKEAFISTCAAELPAPSALMVSSARE